MRCIIFANGYYGKMERYQEIVKDSDIIICADGGADYARQLGVVPALVIGDMDSITADTDTYLKSCGVKFKRYPVHKDFTDLQLALDLAEENGAEEIILLGTLGNRLDHTLANIFSGMETALRGRKVIHYGADCVIYLVTKEIILKGHKGDTVSVLLLTEKARGVTETGFEYALNNADLEQSKPYTVSNVMAADQAGISLEEGILAVMHYR